MAKAPKNVVTWRVDDRQWKVGLAALPVAAAKAVEHRVRALSQEGLERAQARVHVRSGDLRASGRLEERWDGDDYIATVVFGGVGGVDYAGYEETLHPYLDPEMTATYLKFETDGDYLPGVF